MTTWTSKPDKGFDCNLTATTTPPPFCHVDASSRNALCAFAPWILGMITSVCRFQLVKKSLILLPAHLESWLLII